MYIKDVDDRVADTEDKDDTDTLDQIWLAIAILCVLTY